MKYELIMSNQSEMADNYLPGGGGSRSPPKPIRVKLKNRIYKYLMVVAFSVKQTLVIFLARDGD